MSKIRVSYGPSELEVESGTAENVNELRQQLQEVFNIPDSALAQVDGVQITKEDEKKPLPDGAKAVTFVKESGSKSL